MNAPLDQLFGFHQGALAIRGARQQVLATNIANGDTPGFQARDIDFSKALNAALQADKGSPSLARTSARHIGSAGSSGVAEPALPLLYRTPLQPSADGNTVDMDGERSRFAENALHVEANLTFINHQIKAMLAVLQG